MTTIVNLYERIYSTKDFIMNAIYVISIALQLSAAMLLVGNTSVSKKGIIKAYCKKHTAIVLNKDGFLADYGSLKEVIKSSWTNRLAFTYLFFGYLLGVLGQVPMDRFLAILVIALLAVILYILTDQFAKYKSQHFGKVHLDDLPLEEGVEFKFVDEKEYTKDDLLNRNK